ncbi:MAG TPA: hypothetical protein PKD54_07045 [Pirellulaceae bacterium]|nr:hypothetical protein [Pirellulaceae bacterium]
MVALFLLFIPIAITIFGIVVLAWLVRWHLLNHVYRELAKRYAGWLDRHWLLPMLRVPYRGVETRVYSTWRGHGRIQRTTLARVAWPNRRQRLLACHPALFSDLPARRFGRMVELRHSRSPNDLMFITNDADWAGQWLEQDLLDRLQALLVDEVDRATWLTIERGWLTLHRAGSMRDRPSLEALLRDAWRAFDVLTLFKQQGVTFVNEQRSVAAHEIVCPVCSQTASEPRVMCASCKTPHCRDCWDYNGGCAVFACGDKKCQAATLTCP